MLKQSEKQNQKSSIDIEYLLLNDLRPTVETYIAQYGKTLDAKLGLTEDDLINDMREQIWKGLLTFNPKGAANLKTYLCTLIKNRFIVLFKRSKIRKNNMVQYYASVFESPADEECFLTEDTGEAAFMQRQIIKSDQMHLKGLDLLIYQDLLLGRTLLEMCKLHNASRIDVIASINKINDLIMERANREA